LIYEKHKDSKVKFAKIIKEYKDYKGADGRLALFADPAKVEPLLGTGLLWEGILGYTDYPFRIRL
jgi:hypothetical protein